MKERRVCLRYSTLSVPTTSLWFLTTRLLPTISSVSGNWNRPRDSNYVWRRTLLNAEIFRRPMEAPNPSDETKTSPKPEQPPVQKPAQPKSRMWTITGFLVAFVLAIVIWQHFTSPAPRAADRPEKVASDKPAASDTIAVNEQQLKQISTDMVKQQLVAIDRKATGKVGFNEDRLTPVFTPFAGRVVELLA